MNINEFHALTDYEKAHIEKKIVGVCREFLKHNSIPLSIQKTYKALEFNKKVVNYCIYNNKEFINEAKEKAKQVTAVKRTTFIAKAVKLA